LFSSACYSDNNTTDGGREVGGFGVGEGAPEAIAGGRLRLAFCTKGIVSGFISFCLLYTHNSLLPVEGLERLGWVRDPQRSVWPSSPKGNYCDWVYFIPVMNDSNTLG